MKVLLVLPTNRSYVSQPNLGLGYLASSLRKAGHSVFLLDGLRTKLTLERFRDIIRRSRFDAIGFHMFSQDYHWVAACCSVVKQIDGGIITLAGGPHPSGDPDGTIKEMADLDFLFSGESDLALTELLALIESDSMQVDSLSQIPGLYSKDIHQTTKLDDCIVRSGGSAYC